MSEPTSPESQPAKRPRGFAAMDPARQRQIASMGGKTAHERGLAHEFTSEEAREAGRKGGRTLSQDRKHMSLIGTRGGRARARITKDRDRSGSGRPSRDWELSTNA